MINNLLIALLASVPCPCRKQESIATASWDTKPVMQRKVMKQTGDINPLKIEKISWTGKFVKSGCLLCGVSASVASAIAHSSSISY